MTLLEAFEEERDTKYPADSSTLVSSTPLAWRHVPLESKYLTSGLSQESPKQNQDLVEYTLLDDETSFLTTSDISCLPDDSIVEATQISLRSESDDDAVTQFYENSFIIHEELPTSNLTALRLVNESTLGSSPRNIEGDQHLLGLEHTRPKPRSHRLTTLREIPNAAHLHYLEPQTVTIDLVVGILHILPPRTIRTRRYNRLVDLVELTVADDTKAGFGVSMWLSQDTKLSNSKKAPSQNLQRSTMTRLRPRDIILIRNLALATFQKKVHGQSLKKANTTLDLLYRIPTDSDDEQGAYSMWEVDDNNGSDLQLNRIKEVQDWIMSFVGSGPSAVHEPITSSKESCNRANIMQQLPSDTP